MQQYRYRPRYEEERPSPGWKEFIYDFIEKPIRNIAQPILDSIEMQREKFFRSVTSLIITTLGSIFLLLGIVKFINVYLALGDWPGYLILGILLVIIGFATKKINHY